MIEQNLNSRQEHIKDLLDENLSQPERVRLGNGDPDTPTTFLSIAIDKAASSIFDNFNKTDSEIEIVTHLVIAALSNNAQCARYDINRNTFVVACLALMKYEDMALNKWATLLRTDPIH